MNRRVACGVLLAVVLVGGGRLLREQLLTGPSGEWRETEFLGSLLPALAQPDERPAKARSLSGPLDINSAPVDSLVLLSGVGPVLAGRIVAERLANGPFATPRDLQRVKGIGPVGADKLAPFLIFAPEDSSSSEHRSINHTSH